MKSKLATLTVLDIFGKPYRIKGTVLGIRQHGYNLPSGGWSLYPGKDGTPAEFVLFRRYRKRKVVGLNRNEIVGGLEDDSSEFRTIKIEKQRQPEECEGCSEEEDEEYQRWISRRTPGVRRGSRR